LELYLDRPPLPDELNMLFTHTAVCGLYAALWYLHRLNEGGAMEEDMTRAYSYALAYSGRGQVS